MSKLVCGVGINDADYPVQPVIEGKRSICHFYRAWMSMFVRCYGKELQHRCTSYIGCSVCKEWLTFSNFKKWMEVHDWKDKCLDKDLLVQGNKVYSPETCVFIPQEVNKLLLSRATKRGVFPIGVSWKKKRSKFVAQVMLCSRKTHLGYFSKAVEAHKAWQVAKKDIIYNVAMEQTDDRLKKALLLRCTQLQHDIDNGLETIKL